MNLVGDFSFTPLKRQMSKAHVFQAPFGFTTIEGLELPDGRYTDSARWTFINCTQEINMAVLGVPTSEFRVSLGLVPSGNDTRDYFNEVQLRNVAHVEKLALSLIRRGKEPLEATKEAIDLLRLAF
jgi:hypothetical protein